MIKVKTTPDTYKSVVLRRAIIICWLLLFVCFAVKIFGGNYFAIMVKSPRFVAFCQFLDGNIILYGLIGLVSSLVSFALFYLALLKQVWFNKRQLAIFLISVFAFCAIRVIIEYINKFIFVSTIINIIQCFIVPIILGFEITTLKSLGLLFLGNLLNFGFQFIAIITKSIGIRFITDSSLEMLIFTIDVYIMLTLYYLYQNNKKEKEIKK